MNSPSDAAPPPSARITPDSLMTLEAYSRWRVQHRPAVRAHRLLRTVQLGAEVRVQFESETTVRDQIQEMLRIERLFEADAIAQEVAVYAPLMPDGTNWKATLLLAFIDPADRQQALTRLVGIEHRVYIQVAGTEPVYAIADEDLPRSTADKTSAGHFLRFELSRVQRAAVRGGAAVALGCDHPGYTAQVPIHPATLAALAEDLTG